MKIDIKHIVGYLPYGLTAEMLNYKSDYVNKQFDTIIGVHQWDSRNLYWSLLTIGGSKPELNDIKPILRPMSDLTKEIYINDVSFVPMEVLLKIALRNIHKSEDLKPYYDCNSVCWSAIVKTKRAYLSLSFDITDNSFVFICDGQTMSVPNQLELFEKLYEWLFDIFKLIPENLAIDINTLNKPVLGEYEGDICNRDECKGVIDLKKPQNGCSCHLSAPCSSCERNYEYCPSCGWEPEQP